TARVQRDEVAAADHLIAACECDRRQVDSKRRGTADCVVCSRLVAARCTATDIVESHEDGLSRSRGWRPRDSRYGAETCPDTAVAGSLKNTAVVAPQVE